jgi:hypothetical protein
MWIDQNIAIIVGTLGFRGIVPKLEYPKFTRKGRQVARMESVGNNVNSPIRTSAIGLLQHLQLLYLPSELDIDEQIQQVTLYFYCI